MSQQLERSGVSAINSKFDERLQRMDKFGGKTVINPFAVVRPEPKMESEIKSEVSSTKKLGAVYTVYGVEQVVDTKFEDTTLLDTYTVRENPKAGHIKFTPGRLEVEHTREK